MPKKPPRNNRKHRELSTVHSAGQGVSVLLQRITRRAQVVLQGSPGAVQQDPLAWLERLRQGLPEEQRKHLREVIEKPGELVLLADSAAWAGRIRLSLPRLAPLTFGQRLTVKLTQPMRNSK